MNIIIKIYIDLIAAARRNNKAGWKFVVIVLISLAMGVNIASIAMLLGVHSTSFSLFKSVLFNNIFSGLLFLFVPYAIINYFIFFKNNKYERLIEKYDSESANGLTFFIYFISSLLIFMASSIIRNHLYL